MNSFNDDIFKSMCTIFIQKLIDIYEPWNKPGVAEFIEIVLYGIRAIYYCLVFRPIEIQTNGQITSFVENCMINYLEFIKQIKEDDYTFLELNAKDAATFVYKKHIFDFVANNALHQQQPQQQMNHCVVAMSNEMYKTTVRFLDKFNYDEFTFVDKADKEWWKVAFIVRWCQFIMA
jgi:hypothetical protein